MSHEWPAAGFAQRVAAEERVVVLYHADWCPLGAGVLRDFEAAEGEASVPFARANLAPSRDPRWDAMRVKYVPTLCYYEHGEELEREESARDAPVTRRDLEHFLEIVETLNEEPPPNRHPKFRARRI